MIMLFFSLMHLCRGSSILLCVHDVLTKCLADSSWLCLVSKADDKASARCCTERHKLDEESQCWGGKITSWEWFSLWTGGLCCEKGEKMKLKGCVPDGSSLQSVFPLSRASHLLALDTYLLKTSYPVKNQLLIEWICSEEDGVQPWEKVSVFVLNTEARAKFLNY